MATSSSPKSIAASRTMQLVKAAGGGGGSITLPVATLYRNTFESKTPDPGELNNINFNFTGMYNGLVTDIDGGTTGGRVYLPASGIIEPPSQVPGKDWRAQAGTVSMLVSAAAQTGTGNAEQNALSDTLPARDTWVRYWMRIPTNYAPTTNHSTSQHKIFVLFQDAYEFSGDGSTCFMNFYYNSATGHMASGILHSDGGGTGGGGVSAKTQLFHATNDRGKWLQFVLLHRMESSPGASDGAHKFWSRFKEDDSFTLQNARTGITLKRSTVAGAEGWRRWRFLSAREGDAAERQDFLFDEIEVSDQPLVPAGTEGL
jgi:hypothetical protein